MTASSLPSLPPPPSPPSLHNSLHHRISEFQQSLHTSILALVHASSPSASSLSRASSSSPPSHYDLQHWLRQQIVQCLDAEKVYLQASTPSLPPSFLPASPPPAAPPSRITFSSIPDPRQLSHALHELSISTAAVSAPSAPIAAPQLVSPPLPFRRPQQRSTTNRDPARHHHHAHSHAVEVSVRCLPPTSDRDEESSHRGQDHDQRDDSPLPPLPSSMVTFTALAPPPGSSFERGQRGELTMATSACPPGCSAPSLSPCTSPCGMDFGCIDPSPFSLSCDGEDDPLCCFSDVVGAGDGGGEGMMGEEAHLTRLCPSPLSSLCLPMPCDPCSGVTQTMTTTTTTTVLSSCRQGSSSGMYHEHLDDESNPSSPTHSDARGLQQPTPHGKVAATTLVKGGEEEKALHGSSDSARAAGALFPSSAASGFPSSIMVSCHQCKLKKPQEQCLQCSCNDQPSQGGSRKDASGRKRCVKKYCQTSEDSHPHPLTSPPTLPSSLTLTSPPLSCFACSPARAAAC